MYEYIFFFFFQAEDGIRDADVTGVQTCALPISINGKRSEITLKDVLTIAEEFAIKNPKGIIQEVESLIPRWVEIAKAQEIPTPIIEKIHQDLQYLLP